MNLNLAQVFSDTQKRYGSHPALVSACEYSRKNHAFIGAGESVARNLNRFTSRCAVSVSKKRSFEAAESYAQSGERVAVLNFANSYHAGGGVIFGARAQEECLCRISTLYNSIASQEMHKKFYAPHSAKGNDLANDDIIYTPKVTVFKSDTDEPALRPESEWFSADVITCAAPCLNNGRQTISYDALKEIHTSRARHILDVACNYEADVVILGAFGCGAFRNPPEIVAEAYKNVLSEYERAFKTVEFAVYCNKWDAKNYDVFKKMLK